MNFYPFHIGDYMSHTRHLSETEDLAYRRLLDYYYLHEKPLEEDPTCVARLINMRSTASEVESVLEEFFEFKAGVGWVNPRADAEIARYRKTVEARSRAGLASAQQRLNTCSTSVQLTKTNTRTMNIEKKNIKKKSEPVAEGVDEKVWQDFIELRKAKKAPLTSTALEGIKREAGKAGWSLNQALTDCVLRGWQGFKAEWVNKPAGKSGKFDPVEFVNKGREGNVIIDITPGQ
jgi:uncharacterized protein YdaU (DUF1376 family)